ncbi:MAG: response regulator transcription factor [Solirubrobacterales bacterium]
MSAETRSEIVIADDHAVVRSALRALLEAERGLEVRAEAGDVEEAIALATELRPAVLVLDLSMGSGSGLEAIPRILEGSPETRVVVVTMHADPATARAALEAGASAYVLKASAAAELVKAVRDAVRGRTHIGAEMQAKLERQPLEGPAESELTERETEVLGLIALGYTNNEVAERLGLSVRTVESHRVHVQQKLGIQSRAELVRYALDNGMMQA